MVVFLHTDSEPASQSWHSRLYKIITDTYYLPCVKVNLAQSGTLQFLKESVNANDIFVGRIKHTRSLLDKVQPIYDEVCDIFNDRCFPCRQSMYYYDDKRRQLDLFVQKKYPIPLTQYIENINDISIPFPLVCKKTWGASSKQVSIVKSPQELVFPCIVQEFCEGNEGDVRINVIGHRVMGYLRTNRPNDFRASGSGLLSYPTEFPKECVDLAYKISNENEFDSMAYDFLKRKDEWVVLEFSYTYVDKYVLDCPFYYNMNNGLKTDKIGMYPEEFILEDLMLKCNSRFI